MDKSSIKLRPAVSTDALLSKTRSNRKRKHRAFKIDMKALNHVFIAQGKMLRLLHLLTILSHGRHTIAEIADKLGQKPRTVYRYVNLLEALDISVEKDFQQRYFLASDACPFCGKEVHHG